MSATPREPHDAEEARLARVYGALPGGEPSAALDARILAHARAAVRAPAPVRRRPWFLGAGLGTAAAAVFAAGIAWQLGVFAPDRGLSSVPVQQPVAEEDEVDRIDIEFVRRDEAKREAPPAKDKERDADAFPADAVILDEPAPMAVPAPPPPAPAMTAPAASVAGDAATEALATEAADAPVAAEEMLAKPAAQAQPESALRVSPQAAAPARADSDDRAAEDTAIAPAEAFRDAPAPASAPAPAASAPAAQARQELERRRQAVAAPEPATAPLGAVAGSRVRGDDAASRADTAGGAGEREADSAGYARGLSGNAAGPGRDDAESARLAKQAGLPPWAEDNTLAPAAWLERIRDRVQAGDRQGAEHSLRRFVLAHPSHRVPRDLQRLLAE